MLRGLLTLAAAATVQRFLRPRWKWWAVCVGFGLLGHYAYAEYVDYIRLLASMGEVDAIADRLSAAFVAKYLVVGAAVVALASFEVRLARRRNTSTAPTAKGRFGRAAGPAQVRSEGSLDRSSAEPSPTEGATDDGFDFLRHGRRLRTRSQRILERK